MRFSVLNDLMWRVEWRVWSLIHRMRISFSSHVISIYIRWVHCWTDQSMKTWRGVRKICRICYYFLFTHTSPEINVEWDRWRHNVIDFKFWRITLHGEDSVVRRRHAQLYTKVTFPDRGLLSSCLVCAFVSFSAATFPFRFRQTWIIWC